MTKRLKLLLAILKKRVKLESVRVVFWFRTFSISELLNCSKYFHFGENLILDAMHDFLEGVVPFMIKLFIRELYSCGTTQISATELNRRILLFHFSFYDLSNKPSTKFIDAGIRKRKRVIIKQNNVHLKIGARLEFFLYKWVIWLGKTMSIIFIIYNSWIFQIFSFPPK